MLDPVKQIVPYKLNKISNSLSVPPHQTYVVPERPQKLNSTTFIPLLRTWSEKVVHPCPVATYSSHFVFIGFRIPLV